MGGRGLPLEMKNAGMAIFCRAVIAPPHAKQEKPMFKKILIALVVIVTVFAAIVARQPADFRIERSITITAPAEAVYEQVNDFHKWAAWSPWEKLDPTMQRTYEGASAGFGAIYSWTGNKAVGAGRMTLTETHPPLSLMIKLEFLKPFKATNMAEFTFKPDGNQTRVTWAMTGRNNFISRAFCMFINMDKMVGGDF